MLLSLQELEQRKQNVFWWSASAGLLSRGRPLVGWTRGPWSHSLEAWGPQLWQGPQALAVGQPAFRTLSTSVNWKELTGWVGAGCGSSPFPMAKAASLVIWFKGSCAIFPPLSTFKPQPSAQDKTDSKPRSLLQDQTIWPERPSRSLGQRRTTAASSQETASTAPWPPPKTHTLRVEQRDHLSEGPTSHQPVSENRPGP